jgi:hypothetical protein
MVPLRHRSVAANSALHIPNSNLASNNTPPPPPPTVITKGLLVSQLLENEQLSAARHELRRLTAELSLLHEQRSAEIVAAAAAADRSGDATPHRADEAPTTLAPAAVPPPTKEPPSAGKPRAAPEAASPPPKHRGSPRLTLQPADLPVTPSSVRHAPAAAHGPSPEGPSSSTPRRLYMEELGRLPQLTPSRYSPASPKQIGDGGGGGESFLRVYSVAAPDALRARRLRRRRRRRRLWHGHLARQRALLHLSQPRHRQALLARAFARHGARLPLLLSAQVQPEGLPVTEGEVSSPRRRQRGGAAGGLAHARPARRGGGLASLATPRPARSRDLALARVRGDALGDSGWLHPQLRGVRTGGRGGSAGQPRA